MFEIVSLSEKAAKAADRRGRKRVGRVLAASVAASALVGASSATATAVNAPESAEDAGPAATDQVLRNDLAAWSDWKAEQVVAATQAAIAAEANRPKSVVPAIGILTSLFGPRWGAMHAGIDIAGPIGTPIVSVMDGTVIEAGPASGFGLWVRVQHDDGTVSVYGHVNDILSAVGQRVRAGDVIATIGNRGQSTGPHLHLEIWLPGGEKIDPLGWLAAHGVVIAAQLAS